VKVICIILDLIIINFMTDSTQSNRGRGRGRGSVRLRGCTILAGTSRGSEENENVRSPYALRSKRN
jgi:hypothetical protein